MTKIKVNSKKIRTNQTVKQNTYLSGKNIETANGQMKDAMIRHVIFKVGQS